MESNTNLNKALEDVLTLKRLIDESQTLQARSTKVGVITANASGITHMIALAGCASMIALELFSSPTVTEMVLITKQEPNLQIYGIGSLAYILFLLVGVLYFILWRAAGTAGVPFETYVRKNFSYLKNMNLLSDLFVKFCFASVLILAQKPEWFAPMLVLFTADYLIQGRFFHLSVKISYLLGIACLIFSFTEFYFQMSSVLWPLLIFAGLTSLSLTQLYLSRNKVS